MKKKVREGRGRGLGHTVALLAAAGGGCFAAGAAPPPYYTAPPKIPDMTRTREQIPPEVINRVIELPAPDAPKPPADPRDFEGVWTNASAATSRVRNTITGWPVPFNAAGAATISRRITADNESKPIANAQSACRPPGAMRQIDLNFPFRIFQSDDQIDIIFEEFHSIWQIRMNQPHRIGGAAEYSGDSIGHWDGNTLVVETTNFKIPLWFDTAGAPIARDAKMTFRMRKIDEGRNMEIIITVDDPRHYTATWSAARKMIWLPNRFLGEYNCEKQVGDEAGDAAYGLQRETE